MLIPLCKAISFSFYNKSGALANLYRLQQRTIPYLKRTNSQWRLIMLPFNFHCLILSLLNSRFFQDCSCQALNSLITFWPQQDWQSPRLPEHQALGSHLSASPHGTSLTRLLIPIFTTHVVKWIYSFMYLEWHPPEDSQNPYGWPWSTPLHQFASDMLPRYGTSCIPTSHVALLLFCLEWMSLHTAKDAL